MMLMLPLIYHWPLPRLIKRASSPVHAHTVHPSLIKDIFIFKVLFDICKQNFYKIIYAPPARKFFDFSNGK